MNIHDFPPQFPHLHRAAAGGLALGFHVPFATEAAAQAHRRRPRSTPGS